MNINFVHIHLLLNHVPTLGTIFAFGMLLLAFVRKSDEVRRTSLALFFAVAMISIPAYMTGYSAEIAVGDRPGVSKVAIEQHQSAALLALIVMEITGIVAWFGLWQARRPGGAARWNAPVVVLLAVVTIALMASAATIGGEIRHPEIVVEGQPSATESALAPAVLKTKFIALFQFQRPWAWPTLEALHFIGLCLLSGVAMVGNLRVLGLMKRASFHDVHKLLPWGVWGFALNAVTGMLFFIGAAGQYVDNLSFHWKVVFMLLAAANVLYLTLIDDLWALQAGDRAPAWAQVMAASQLFLWVGVIYFGRMLPYIGNAF